jgi:hypothetical protein
MMRRVLFVGAILLFGVSISLTVGAKQVTAQGPAGAGASTAAQDSSRSFNPINWVKKDSKNSIDEPGIRSDIEKKLTPRLQAQGVLAVNVTAVDACAPFAALDQCLAALHASHNLGMDFNCLRAGVTAVLTSVDLSGCKLADTEKAQALDKTIHQLKPDANAKQAKKEAEQQAKDDLKGIGG